MTGPGPDPLDGIRRARREPAAETVAFLVTLQEGVCRRQPEELVLDPDRIRDMYPNLSSAEVTGMAGYLAQVRSSIRPPTPYEGAAHHANLQLMAAQLDEAVVRLDRWPLTRPPVFALLEYGHLDARTVLAPTGDHIVLVDAELLQFVFLFSKAVAFAVSGGAVDGEPLARFASLVLSYAMTGRTSHADAYQVPADAERLGSLLTRSAQNFLLAHEYAHVLEGHPDARDMSLVGVADRIGLDLTLEVMTRAGHDFTTTYWGVELYLYATEIAAQAIPLLRTGDRPHAAATTRRTMLPVLLHSDVIRTVGQAEADETWERLEPGLHVVQEIVDELWEQTQPLLLAAHRRGVRPAGIWPD